MSAYPFPKKAAESPAERFIPSPNLKLQEQFAEVCCFKHLARRTEEICWE